MMEFYTAGVRNGEVRVGKWELPEVKIMEISTVSTRESALFAFTSLLDAALDAEDEPIITIALRVSDESLNDRSEA
jgi:hypothetical protein